MSTTGILYFSRVPRDMRPSEIREFFSSRFGEIFRQKFIVEETNTKKAQQLRRKVGKSKSLQFKEGWLEFTEFACAEEAAAQMNSQPVEVKHRRRANGELWCCRCLPQGYRWEDLVTEIEGDKRLRRMKINAELQREREINEQYRQKAYKLIAAQKHRLRETGGEDDGEIEFEPKPATQQQQHAPRDPNLPVLTRGQKNARQRLLKKQKKLSQATETVPEQQQRQQESVVKTRKQLKRQRTDNDSAAHQEQQQGQLDASQFVADERDSLMRRKLKLARAAKTLSLLNGRVESKVAAAASGKRKPNK